MKNIVFDLGGVLFARDKSKCTPELLEFFSFLRAPRMPLFWDCLLYTSDAADE